MIDLVFTSFSLNYRTGNVSERLNLTVKVSVSAIMVGIYSMGKSYSLAVSKNLQEFFVMGVNYRAVAYQLNNSWERQSSFIPI